MSAYTSLHITRKKALVLMLSSFIENLEKNISDEQLEEFMDRHLEHRLYNCVIVDDDYINSDDGMV